MVSKTTLQPTSRSWCGPRVSPAGWQDSTENSGVSTAPLLCGSILTTAPSEPAAAGGCRGSVMAAGAVHFRDGHIELASARIPHRLFRAIGRIDAARRVER